MDTQTHYLPEALGARVSHQNGKALIWESLEIVRSVRLVNQPPLCNQSRGFITMPAVCIKSCCIFSVERII